LLFLHKTDNLELSVIAIPTIINILWVFFAWKVTAQFNESKGECLNAPRESD
jgi:heme/copper-type cytochrome/quinol oxidase subunit 2